MKMKERRACAVENAESKYILSVILRLPAMCTMNKGRNEGLGVE